MVAHPVADNVPVSEASRLALALLIHYELPYLTSLADAWFYVFPLLLVGFLTAFLLWKNRPLGFLGTFFFAILSPTFVIPVVTEMAAERRMYLALVPLILIFVIGIYRLAQVFVRQRQALSAVTVFCALGRGRPADRASRGISSSSASRLAAYENELTLWLEVMQAQPENPGHSLRRHFSGEQGKTTKRSSNTKRQFGCTQIRCKHTSTWGAAQQKGEL